MGVLCKVGSVLQSNQFIYSNLESFTDNNTNYKGIQKRRLRHTRGENCCTHNAI